LRQAERLREDLGVYAGGLAGQIRVLSNTNALTEFLPEALSSFLSEHPNVSIDLEERLSDEIVGLIAEGVADLGIVAATVDVSALETYPFRKDRFVLAVAREHPLAKRSKIAFADVLEHDFVGLDRASALQRFLADKAARIGQPLRLRVQLRSFDAVCRLVECNVGSRHRTRDHRAAGSAHHGDRCGGIDRSVGGARTHDLHPQSRRAAALRPSTRRAFTKARVSKVVEPR
jgi:Transcriptional regulator